MSHWSRLRPCLPMIPVLMAVPAILSLASCAVAVPTHEVMMEGERPDEEIYVREEPPPPREEVVVGVAPGPSYIWVGGYWTRHHTNWYWVQGRWAARPRPNVTWVSGHWERHDRGHIWVSGRWR
jgi:hypothetical protein